MGKTNEAARFLTWVQVALKELKWTQKRLSAESGIVYSTLNDILNGKIMLSAEMAERLAGVPELKTTKEELLTLAGVWAGPKSSQKRDVMLALFDQLSKQNQDLAIDFVVWLAQREKRQE